MANNRIQVKRTSTTGRTANVTNSGNTQYIAAGELALNMTDGILYSSNGSALIEVGSNNTTQRLTNALIMNNDKRINFNTVNTSVSSYFVQQNDDNFVFYTTNTAYGQRAVWSIFANSVNSAFDLVVPLKISSALIANSSNGTAGQVLTSNGTTVYWSSAGGGGSGTVTSVATGNGMTGGPITTTGTVSVLANTGIVANATGVFVNAAYIATIASNSATYANSSVTNTFTVGTASYFVSNGNLGIGNTTPVTKLYIDTQGEGIRISPVNANHRLRLYSGEGGNYINADYDANQTFNIKFDPSPRSGTTGGLKFEYGTRGVTVTDATYPATFQISPRGLLSSNPAMYFDSAGKIGLSNTVPAHALSVNGDMFVNTSVTVGNSTVNATVNSTAFTGTANNSTYLGGYTWAAPAILGSTTANGGSFTYANVSGQVNTVTLHATTSVNVNSNVQLSTSRLLIGNATVNTVVNSSFIATSGVYLFSQAGASANTSEGTVFYDSVNHALNVYYDDPTTPLEIGEQRVLRVINKSGTAIPFATPVYVAGVQGTRPAVAPARANSSAYDCIGVVLASGGIANNAEGFILSAGIIKGVDTRGYTAGDVIWLGNTAGNITATQPCAKHNYVHR